MCYALDGSKVSSGALVAIHCPFYHAMLLLPYCFCYRLVLLLLLLQD